MLLVMAVLLDGTGGGGDSILHYQYARYAGQHPENFFYHWAKPVFTFLAFPFSQAGFIGIKIFNILCSCGAAWLGFLTLKATQTPYRWMYPLLLFSAPLYVTVTLSGLTEPLSALMIMAIIYCCVREQYLFASLLVSFLPFVRSEGLIIISIFIVYLLVKKRYRYIPWTITGHVVLSIAGSFYHHDLLWVFRKIPYARLGSGYGKGTWGHFANQLFFQLGPLLYVVLMLGLIVMLRKGLSAQQRKTPFFAEQFWLTTGIFFSFFVSHTIFWALGIFNSMGLVRVFVTVIPAAVLIMIWGLNTLMEVVSIRTGIISNSVMGTVLITALLLPFMKGPYAYKIPDDFILEPVQQLMKNTMVPYLEQKHPGKTWIVADSDISFFAQRDPFDKKQVKWFYEQHDMDSINNNELIICDSWFAPVEWGWDEHKLEALPTLKRDTTFVTLNAKGQEVRFSVFIHK